MCSRSSHVVGAGKLSFNGILMVGKGSSRCYVCANQDAQSRGGGVFGRRLRIRERDREPENAPMFIVDLFRDPTEAPIAMGMLPATCGELPLAAGIAIALVEAAWWVGGAAGPSEQHSAGR